MKFDDIEKTVFNKKHGHFKYLFMAVGAFIVSTAFQTLNNGVFYDNINKFVMVSIDDDRTFRKDWEVQYKHFETVYVQHQDNQQYAYPRKCKLFKEEIDFLRKPIGQNDFKINPEKVKEPQKWLNAKFVKNVCSSVEIL